MPGWTGLKESKGVWGLRVKRTYSAWVNAPERRVEGQGDYGMRCMIWGPQSREDMVQSSRGCARAGRDARLGEAAGAPTDESESKASEGGGKEGSVEAESGLEALLLRGGAQRVCGDEVE